MQSTAPTVKEYLTEVPEERLTALEQLRALCLKHLKDFDENMSYGMPGYSRDGEVEVALLSQKNNIALYILRTDVLNPRRELFAKSNIGKGCIRYPNPNKIDFQLVADMLEETASSKGPVC
ncbi:MAG: DUF1801 domain-containing protein [Anaerolineae bacterium]|nr:DUF1801 domain-containing protein [Anaerolineae bacterium]